MQSEFTFHFAKSSIGENNALLPITLFLGTRTSWKCQKVNNIWWRHQMETFSALLALCTGNSPITGKFHAKRPVTRSFGVFWCAWINGWVNSHEAGDLRRHCAHYDVTVMNHIADAPSVFYMRSQPSRGKEIPTTGKRYGIFGKHNENTRIWHFGNLQINCCLKLDIQKGYNIEEAIG